MMLFKGGCTHLRCMFGDNQRPLAIDQKLSAEIVPNKFTLVSDRAFKLIGKLIGMEEWHDAFIFTSLGVSAAFTAVFRSIGQVDFLVDRRGFGILHRQVCRGLPSISVK